MQIDACRVAGVNENVANLLLTAKFGVPVCPHAGGVGLCEIVQHRDPGLRHHAALLSRWPDWSSAAPSSGNRRHSRACTVEGIAVDVSYQDMRIPGALRAELDRARQC